MSRSSEGASRVRDAAFRLLAVRARTVDEMRRRLRKKDFEPAVVEEVVNRLRERGHLDDEAFCREFLLERLHRRPRGRFALVQELRKRGVERPLAERMVDEVFAAEDVDEAEVARDAARDWLGKRSPGDREVLATGGSEAKRLRRRLYAYLERRGFPRSTARRILDEIVRELTDG